MVVVTVFMVVVVVVVVVVVIKPYRGVPRQERCDPERGGDTSTQEPFLGPDSCSRTLNRHHSPVLTVH
ncbi:hypothetical protein E2C01_034663 [Portunus trituberculatus]|uniref:Uncharacterized protein n=1 Tax=Portunus trituberculatus TaxID=210409 RepID=A0A5B7F7M1_PORTR|nr:hypothetical protein [Portunus trituberculatus]